jgi:protein SCO1/2
LQNGTVLPGGRDIAAFSLQDQDGQPFSQTQLRGVPSLLFFGFTHCPDVCPETLALMAALQRAQSAADLRVIFVTVDPGRDDTQTLRNYVRAFSNTMVGLRGEDAQLEGLLRSLGAVRLLQATPDGSYNVDHSATLYYIGADGRLASVFTPPFSLPGLTADLQTLASVRSP